MSVAIPVGGRRTLEEVELARSEARAKPPWIQVLDTTEDVAVPRRSSRLKRMSGIILATKCKPLLTHSNAQSCAVCQVAVTSSG
jgi:hypothetical protein